MAPYPHMPAGAQPSGTSGFGSRVVNLVAVGGELDLPAVAIGATMADLLYAITWSSAGGTSGDGKQTSGIEVADLPVASRTTTTFRVVFGAPLTAGDRVQFVITGSIA